MTSYVRMTGSFKLVDAGMVCLVTRESGLAVDSHRSGRLRVLISNDGAISRAGPSVVSTFLCKYPKMTTKVLLTGHLPIHVPSLIFVGATGFIGGQLLHDI